MWPTVNPPSTVTPIFYSRVKADGVTSDDAQLASDVSACSTVGGKLILPAGQILLTGGSSGTVQIHLLNCGIVGAEVPSASPNGVLDGTTFLITGSITPFIGHYGWSMTGVNFYYPGQTDGETSYPPLFADTSTSSFGPAYLDKVNIVNAYDGFTQTMPTVPPTAGGWASVQISNSTLYAVHRLFSLSTLGDSWLLTNVRFVNTPWQYLCGSKCSAGYANAQAKATLLYAEPTTGLPGVTIVIKGAETFGWNKGIELAASASPLVGGIVEGSLFDVAWDGINTLIDASATGASYSGNQFTGQSTGCASTCFAMGATSVLNLNNFQGGGSSVSYITSTGSSIYLNNVATGANGTKADGSDYYIVDVTANSSTEVNVQGSQFAGLAGNANTHGITASVDIARFIVQNTGFLAFKDDINTQANQTTIVTGNWSGGTYAGTGAVRSFISTPTGNVNYNNNSFDRPPLPSITFCGSGAALARVALFLARSRLARHLVPPHVRSPSRSTIFPRLFVRFFSDLQREPRCHSA